MRAEYNVRVSTSHDIPVQYWTFDVPQDLTATICDRSSSPIHFEIALRDKRGGESERRGDQGTLIKNNEGREDSSTVTHVEKSSGDLPDTWASTALDIAAVTDPSMGNTKTKQTKIHNDVWDNGWVP